jgi:hypothetical protein
MRIDRPAIGIRCGLFQRLGSIRLIQERAKGAKHGGWVAHEPLVAQVQGVVAVGPVERQAGTVGRAATVLATQAGRMDRRKAA